MFEIFHNKAKKMRKEKKGDLHLPRKPNANLIYIIVLHYKALCILTTSDFSHLKGSRRQDEMVCQADFCSVLFPQIITRDKLLN